MSTVHRCLRCLQEWYCAECSDTGVCQTVCRRCAATPPAAPEDHGDDPALDFQPEDEEKQA